MAENREPTEPAGTPESAAGVRAEELKEIIEELERIFAELDEVRERYKALLQTDFEATVSDAKSVKSLLKKYSQLIP